MKKMALRTLLFLFLLTLGSIPALAAPESRGFDESALSDKGQQAYQDLLTTKTFTLAAFGAAAAPFRSTALLWELLQEDQAENALESLAQRANPEGQTYALLGLQVIKSKKFGANFETFKATLGQKGIREISSEEGGCCGEPLSLKIDQIIQEFDSGNFAQRFTWVFGDLQG